MPKNLEKYRRQIAEGLEKTFSNPSHTMSLELDSLRLVLFSDLHRGARDGADDFQRCERAYNAALAYYFRSGHTLCLLGDVEELWECRPSTVLDKYKHTYELERSFRQAGRYWRIWGNHDDLWSHRSAVEKFLGPPIGLDVPFWESLRLEVKDHGTRLGELFFVHGHQGTGASDRFGGISRLAVRYIWRNFQRVTKVASTTPAKDWELRQKHEEAMFRWALTKRELGLILFAGHTHRPVFKSESLVDRLTRELAELERSPATPERFARRRDLEAELEWVRTSEFQTPPTLRMEAPCFFNTGCGSFGDGDVTGLEIADGKIQLVRWPNNLGKPLPEVLNLEPADLRRCFEEVRGLPRVEVAPAPEREPVPSVGQRAPGWGETVSPDPTAPH
jgi:UDP-2,3-diacylglucosamine pyrophosphatase LpxH